MSIFYYIADPEQALDDMVLTEANFAGVGDLVCMRCGEEMVPGNEQVARQRCVAL